jgi:acetyl esterase/lipase
MAQRYVLSAIHAFVCLGFFTVRAVAEEKLPEPPIPPTAANLAYGPLELQVLDFWQAKSEKPAPLALFIHTGGWTQGDKSWYYKDVPKMLDEGISAATINYRLIAQANAQKVTPPVKAPLEDAARALQFIRSKAAEWNIDKKRIGAIGDSAGGCTALWLAFHDDMADPNATDPVARESTRLCCAAVFGAQVTLDPVLVRQWLPNYLYGTHAFGVHSFEELIKQREQFAPWIKEYSPYDHVSKDDPPIGLYYLGAIGAKVGEARHDATHSPILGLKLTEKLREHGVEVTFQSSSTPKQPLADPTEFLIHYLKK